MVLWRYKLHIIFSFCFHFVDKKSLKVFSDLCSIRVTFVLRQYKKHARYFQPPLLQVVWISPIAIHLNFWSNTVFNEEFICFDTYLGTCSTVFPFLSLQAIAYLSSNREDVSSLLLAFKISPSLGCQESWKKWNPITQDWHSNAFSNEWRNFFI